MPYRIGEELFLDNVAQETEAPFSAVTRTKQGLVKVAGVDTVVTKGSKNLLTSGAAYDIIGKVITVFQTPSGSPSPVMPLASTTVYGIVKIGSGISVSSGVISLAGGLITSLTPTRIPYAATPTTLADDSALVWDPTNNALIVGDLSGGMRLHQTGHFSNLFLGNNAGKFSGITGTNNTGVGGNVLSSLTSGIQNTVMGYGAGSAMTSATYNVAIGFEALSTSTTGTTNVAVGVWALRSTLNTSGNVAIGYGALANGTAAGADGNTAVGASAGVNAGAGIQNTFIGQSAGSAVTTAQRNTFLGALAGDNVTTGNQNIVIGAGVDAPSTIAAGQLNIQNIIFGTGNTALGLAVSTGNIGIGIAAPTEKLHVAGNILLSGNLRRTAFEVGHLMGGHNSLGDSSAASNPIFAIGDGYAPAATTLGSMFGIGFSYAGSASFLSSFLSPVGGAGGWGLYVAAAGTAPIFFDAGFGIVNSIYYRATGLAGSGLRMVTVDNNGLFSAQAIPGGGSGSPAGATNQIQFNNAGAFGANANFVWDIVNSRVGIGISNPFEKLHVLNGNVQFGGSSLSFFYTAGTGFVGLGTNTPSAILEIQDATGNPARINLKITNSAWLFGNLWVDGSVQTLGIGRVNSTLFGIFAGVDWRVYVASTGVVSILNLAGATTRMVVADTAGNLSTQAIPGGGGGTPAGATNQIQYNNAGAFGANSLFVWDIANGRLGIGTATPARALQITNGDFQISTGNMFVDNLASVGASLQWTSSAHSVVVGINASGNGTANGQWFVYDAGAGTFQLTVQRGSGNVGIGTTAPGYSLDIATASQTAVRIRSSGTAQMNLIFTRTGGTATNWELYTPSGSTDLRFFSGVDVFTFATSGNLTVAGVYKRTTFRTGFLAGGHADLGDSSSMTNPIYAIGSAYGPDTDTTLGGMYGIGYCYGGTASFLSTIGGGWGMYVAAAGLAKIFFDAQFGTIIGNNFRSKDLAGGGTQIVTVDNNGFMLAGGAAPTSGTYTPTITPVTNVSTSSAQVFQYLRVGNTVTISGQINITVTTAASTWIARISLPVASNFTIAGHAAGSIAGGNISQSGFVSADPATDTIILEKPTTPAGNLVYAIHVTYRIL